MTSPRFIGSLFAAAILAGWSALPAQIRAESNTGSGATPKCLAPSDWQGIRAAYEAGRHALMPTETGWQARNPGQQWTTRFDGRGFETTPRGGGWAWGLELRAYGFGDHLTTVGAVPPRVQAEGQRLTYGWDATVQEWWKNDARGLEHGFVLTRRPDQSDRSDPSDLVFLLATRGNLSPRVRADALGVEFTDATGSTVLNYAGLKVWDADGKGLPSRFAVGGEGLVRLLVEDEGARYPVTIDPLAQDATLKAGWAPPAVGDFFGSAVDISGDTVVVGAPQEDASATGVNAAPNDAAPDSGAAYVFVRNAGVWTQQAYLKPAQVGASQAGDLFGISVAISGDTLVVGAYGEDSGSTGVNSVPNEVAPSAGAAYVFVRNAGNWVQQAYLKPLSIGTMQAGDLFGESVAISGDTVVIGAGGEDGNTTGVNNSPNEAAANAGAAYVFVRNAGVWTQQAYLKPDMVGSTQESDSFGRSVSISGDTVVVGSPFEDGGGAGVNATPDESAADSGAAYVFLRSAGVWTQHAYLKPAGFGTTQAGDTFGAWVSISADTVVLGAPLEDGGGTGGNAAPDEALADSGAVYVFALSGGTWIQQSYVKPAAGSSASPSDRFGIQTDISGDTLVVGANGEDSGSLGVNGTPDETANGAGAAYVFARTAGVWTQQAYLKPAAVGGSQAGDRIRAVAVDGNSVVVGAAEEDTGNPGINAEPDEGAPNSGAGYLYVRGNGGVWTQEAFLKVSDPPRPPDSLAGDSFGASVAVDFNGSSGIAVVGAPGDDSGNLGVNAPADDTSEDAGAAYVFGKSGGAWKLECVLKPSAVGSRQSGDRFGLSVAVSASPATVVVGAPQEDSATTGINPAPDENSDNSGAAYVFVRNSGVWTQQAFLKPASVGTTQAGDLFGSSVAFSGGTLVVGAPGEDSGSTGIDGVQTENAPDSGCAYVFSRISSTWTQEAYLKPSQVGASQAGDNFGASVDIFGETVVVGAPGEDSHTTGVNAVSDETAMNSGRAYVFQRVNSQNWVQQAGIKPAEVGSTQAGDFFGTSVSISGDRLLVGAPGEDSGSTGVNSIPDETAVDAGATYAYARTGSTWTQEAYLKPAAVGASQAGDGFGSSVSVDGVGALIGAPNEDGGSSGFNGALDESVPDSGAAYVFQLNGTAWSQRGYLKPGPSGTNKAGDSFGCSVAIDSGKGIIGECGEDSGARGVNTPPDETASDAGAAYAFSGLGVPQIAVRLSSTSGDPTFFTNGASIVSFIYSPPGPFPSKLFRVVNQGLGDLILSSISTVGGNADEFHVNTAATLFTVPSQGTASFTVDCIPSVEAHRSTTLRIVSNDPENPVFDIALEMMLTSEIDGDGDGLADIAEANLSALGFDPLIPQANLVSALRENAAYAGLFTRSQVQALRAGPPHIQHNPANGAISLQIGLETRPLIPPGNFTPLPFNLPGATTNLNGQGKLLFTFPAPGEAAFFRLEKE